MSFNIWRFWARVIFDSALDRLEARQPEPEFRKLMFKLLEDLGFLLPLKQHLLFRAREPGNEFATLVDAGQKKELLSALVRVKPKPMQPIAANQEVHA